MNRHHILGLDNVVGVEQFPFGGMSGNVNRAVTFMYYIGALAHQRVNNPVHRVFISRDQRGGQQYGICWLQGH